MVPADLMIYIGILQQQPKNEKTHTSKANTNSSHPFIRRLSSSSTSHPPLPIHPIMHLHYFHFHSSLLYNPMIPFIFSKLIPKMKLSSSSSSFILHLSSSSSLLFILILFLNVPPPLFSLSDHHSDLPNELHLARLNEHLAKRNKTDEAKKLKDNNVNDPPEGMEEIMKENTTELTLPPTSNSSSSSSPPAPPPPPASPFGLPHPLPLLLALALPALALAALAGAFLACTRCRAHPRGIFGADGAWKSGGTGAGDSAATTITLPLQAAAATGDTSRHRRRHPLLSTIASSPRAMEW